jgi:ADP-ribose pyrophosphatase YjhB (NUDIX family)
LVEPKWLEWGKRLQAIAQNGLSYTENPFDIQRYEQIASLSREILGTYGEIDEEHIRELFSAESGHATPKIDVRGAVFRGDDVLLVRERSDGRWSLPGGWADVQESPSSAAVREILEESGFQTRATKLLALYDRNKHPHPPHQYHVYKVFFQCELLGGEPVASMETDGADFFAEDNLPELSVGRVTSSQLGRFFEHHRHPEWPADFD